jgi:hypothetical protein
VARDPEGFLAVERELLRLAAERGAVAIDSTGLTPAELVAHTLRLVWGR